MAVEDSCVERLPQSCVPADHALANHHLHLLDVLKGCKGRVILSGSEVQIREDVEWLATTGVTEVFFDLNWDPLIGSPDVDPQAAADRASHLLELLKPAAT